MLEKSSLIESARKNKLIRLLGLSDELWSDSKERSAIITIPFPDHGISEEVRDVFNRYST